MTFKSLLAATCALAALAPVSAPVSAFAEDTPLELIAAIKPNVLVKGADYSEATVVGAAEVRSWGGEVRLAPLVEGYSTTAAIARMAKADAER